MGSAEVLGGPTCGMSLPGGGSCTEGMRSAMRCPSTSSTDAHPCRRAKRLSHDVTMPLQETPVFLSPRVKASGTSASNSTQHQVTSC